MRGNGGRLHDSEAQAEPRSTRTILRLPDLDHSKSSVRESLGFAASKRTYGAAIEDFIAWYCSEPRLAFGRTVVLRYRYELEARRLAPATINLRIAAVWRLAYEASDNGLLNPDLAAGVRRVKGAKRLGMRLGNWLAADQGKKLLAAPASNSIKDKRDYAILSLLLVLDCGLRRAELTGLTLGHLQQRDERWAIVNLYGKGGHIRKVPVPNSEAGRNPQHARAQPRGPRPIRRQIRRSPLHRPGRTRSPYPRRRTVATPINPPKTRAAALLS